MINLKRSKKKIKEITKPEVAGGYEESYPYGTRLSFNEDLIDKIKLLQDLDSGTELKIEAKAFACEVRTNESSKTPGKPGKKNVNVEIQVTDIDIKDAGNAEASFDED